MTNQLLPSDENFQYPDWIDTGGDTCLPCYFYYCGFLPTTTTAEYPSRPGGPVGVGAVTQRLYVPDAVVGGSIPVLVTDPETSTGGMRGFIARDNQTFNVDGLDYKIAFGTTVTASTNLGANAGGSNGSSPAPWGRIRYPDTQLAQTDDEETDPASEARSSLGNFYSGTSANATAATPVWAAWEGNVLMFRVGPSLTSEIVEHSDDVSYSYARHVSSYQFIAYPVINTGVGVDLYLELWNIGGGSPPAGRRLIRQVVNNGARGLYFNRPYHLRATVENVSGDPNINCYIGRFIDQTSGVIHDEVQCFKDGVFDNDDYTLGTDTTHTSATGLIVDTDGLTGSNTETFGWLCGVDRQANIEPSMSNGAGGAPQIINVLEGIHEITVKTHPAGAVLYRDLFKRELSTVYPPNPGHAAVRSVTGQFGTQGFCANGLFALDQFAPSWPSGTPTTDTFWTIRPSLLWTDGPLSVDNPTDYISPLIDPEADGYTEGFRCFTHLRPSTEFFNHHRSVTFQAGDLVPTVPSAPTFRFGVLLRGACDPCLSINAVAAYAEWTTDPASADTITALSWKIALVRAVGPSTPAGLLHEPEFELMAQATEIAPFTDLYAAGVVLDFKAQAYSAAPSPDSTALYHVTVNGTPINFNDDKTPLKSEPDSPYPVMHTSVPEGFRGSHSEAFFFDGPAAYSDGGSTQYFYPPRVTGWTEGALDSDPGPPPPANIGTASVGGEGTPVGSLNTSSGALGISGGGVWDVEARVTVESFQPIRGHQFASGHRYTSPVYFTGDIAAGFPKGSPRRRWRVDVRAAGLSVYQPLQSFFNSHNGPEIPFIFIVPIPADGTEIDIPAESTESVNGWFAEDALIISEIGPEVYDISFSVVEQLVS